MIRNHALGPAGSKLPEPYRACCRRPVPSRDGKAPRPLWPLQPPRRWLLGRGPRGRTGIPQVRRGDSTGLDGEGRVSPLVSFSLSSLFFSFFPPPRTRDSAVPRRQNQSCRIVGDLSAGDAVTQRNSGTLCLNYFFSSWRGVSFIVLFLSALWCCNWTGVEWRSIHPHLPRSLPSRVGNRPHDCLHGLLLGLGFARGLIQICLPLPFSPSSVGCGFAVPWCGPAAQSMVGFDLVRLRLRLEPRSGSV